MRFRISRWRRFEVPPSGDLRFGPPKGGISIRRSAGGQRPVESEAETSPSPGLNYFGLSLSVWALLQPPLPLQLFLPLQPLSLPLQPPWPLQLFLPLQSCLPASPPFAALPAALVSSA